MTRKAAVPSTTPVPKYNNKYSGAVVGKDLFATMWRVAVPILGFSIIGMIADYKFNSVPQFTIGSIILGNVAAAYLIIKLLKIRSKETK